MKKGDPLSQASARALLLLGQGGRYLQEINGRWSVTRPNDRPTPINEMTAMNLVSHRMVEPTAHLSRRWFKISEYGIRCLERNTCL